MNITRIAAAATAAALLSTPLAAQETAAEVDTDWYVFVAEDESECLAVSSPQRAEYFRDGAEVSATTDEPSLTVVYRPGEGAMGQVAYLGGFPFSEDEPIEAQVGTEAHALYPDNIWAWPPSAEADAALIEEMRVGREVRLSSFSSRGTNVVHYFSLNGFGPAVDEAARRCDN
ncbi:hypothetical protein OG2516_12051 [Oceanicola granulosus HTCC2516]|uniref:Uncharacterized protein n=1 Tax=Oceanicola granulosus (strain ATCC BAA-861 / DSM 15982 / KCTC 12143 / HTCC2516) TaxID=314256 RepID=Q2CBB4_OCEGH|nr:hypothetical protein [Oceanicola granulosus]EAR49984.1 hypothetical protein OG2516_12051 [Oceanicola granulosus HTCC2516]